MLSKCVCGSLVTGKAAPVDNISRGFPQGVPLRSGHSSTASPSPDWFLPLKPTTAEALVWGSQ